VREQPLRLLAGAAAGALATVADTEQWPDLRTRVAAALAPDLVDLVSARMDEARSRLVAVPRARLELARAEFTTEWRGSIHTMLWERPEAAGPLRAVLHDVGPALPRVAEDFAAGATAGR
jgi:soluble lytic murein transglycosylase-like protein